MAKWIYEKWSVKWDDTTATGEKLKTNSKIDPTTFVMSLSSDFFTGDLAANASTSTRSSWNSGRRAYEGFILITPSGYMEAGYPKSYIHEMGQFRVKDTLIETVTLEEGTVPDDGIHSDQFWYVKVKKAFPTMRILRGGQWIEAESGLVLKDGVWKPIEDVFVLKNGQWKNLQ